MTEAIPLGVSWTTHGARIAVYSADAERIELCLFDRERETARVALDRGNHGVHQIETSALTPGMHYGLRAHGPWRPEHGLRFNPAALLIDPYATRVTESPSPSGMFSPTRDGHDDLARDNRDTASVVPKCITERVTGNGARPPRPSPAHRIIYELHPKGFTRFHPDVPPHQRGTLRGLAHPTVVEYLVGLGITTVELMPIAAALDERHLPPLGLRNAWGYNSVAFMAPDPRLAPGGIADVIAMVDAYHAAGIEVLLDVVLNHTAESDERGATLSLRGLDNRTYYRLRDNPRFYENDTGCGHVLALDREVPARLALDTLRYWASVAGVDGFRMDLGTVLGRTPSGFDPHAPLLRAMEQDPLLADRVIIVEPWDIGLGGYRLGEFPSRFGEWNDRFRDDVRRFWRGDGSIGAFATRIAGSADVFQSRERPPSCSINFVAAHDGFTLADAVRFTERQNWANGEDGRDGHAHEISWSHGSVADEAALLATLLLSRGTPMLSMGAECSRTQGGNNNAYAQDNELNAMPWDAVASPLGDLARALIALRHRSPIFHSNAFGTPASMRWITSAGTDFTHVDWIANGNVIGWLLSDDSAVTMVWFVRRYPASVAFSALDDGAWRCVLHSTGEENPIVPASGTIVLDAPSVSVWRHEAASAPPLPIVSVTD
jgi:glycogen debranching enzyme